MSDTTKFWIDDMPFTSPTRNRLEGKYSVIGVGAKNLTSGFTVKQVKDIPATVTSKLSEVKDTPTGITVHEIKDLAVTATIKQVRNNNLASVLTVNPKNSMYGAYEVIKPIPVVRRLTPTQDTYLRSDRSRVNFGGQETLMVGNYYDNLYRVLMQFNIAEIPQERTILKAEIILEGYDSAPQFDIDAYGVTEQWREHSATWDNTPKHSEKVVSFNGGTGLQKSRLDITKLFMGWYEEETENNGIMLKKVDETVNGLRSYFSKEGLYKPVLEVTYYDPYLYSYGRSNSRWAITINPREDLNTKVEVKATIIDEDLESTLKVTDPENIPSVVDVKQDQLPSTVFVVHSDNKNLRVRLEVPDEADEDILFGKVSPRVGKESDWNTSITVEPAQSRLPTEITVVGLGLEDTKSTLDIVYASHLESTVEVTGNTNTATKVVVKRGEEESLPSKLGVNITQDVSAQLTVTEHTNLNGKVEVIEPFSDTDAKVIVRENEGASTPTKISVRADEESSLQSRLEVEPSTLLPTVLIVNSPDIRGQLEVRAEEYDDVTGIIKVRVKGELDHPSLVAIRTKGEHDIPTKVAVRTVGDNSLTSTIFVKSFDVSDIDMVIEIGTQMRTSYVFIM